MHAENNRLSSAALLWKNVAETEEKLNNATEAMVFSLTSRISLSILVSLYSFSSGSVAKSSELLSSRHPGQ
jgi:hypothetical protein